MSVTITIRTRITLAIGVGVGLLAALLALALWQHVQIAKNMQTIEAVAEEIELSAHLQSAVSMALMPANDYLITGQVNERDKFIHLSGEVDQLLRRFGALVILDEEQRVLLGTVGELHQRLNAMGEEIFALPAPVGNRHAAILMKRYDATGNEIIGLLDKLHRIDERKLEYVQQQAARAQRQAFQYLTSGGIFLSVLALLSGVRLARSISRPIGLLESGTERIAAGNWAHRVEIQSGDELEALARHFNGMAEKLGTLHHTLENQVAQRTSELSERVQELDTLLKTSTALSATLEMDQLLTLIAERMTSTLKTTYCRIALIDAEHPEPVIRAAYPIRMLDWEPGIGTVLEQQLLPDLRTAFETQRYVLLCRPTMNSPERQIEYGKMLTPETQSALIFPLILSGHAEGMIILGETRIWEREPFSPEKIALCQTLANQAVIAIANARNYADLQEMFLSTVGSMASAIDAKSPWTMGHSERMTQHAMALGEQLGLEPAILNHLRLGCILHDIGKIGTDEAILEKPGRLTDAEMLIMQQHPVRGDQILRPIRQFKPILSVVRHHHERYDGKGYPDGLKGENIPLLARIAALADTYDAMTFARPYRAAASKEEAIAEIKRFAGTQFDPSIAAVFVAMLESAEQ